MNELSKSFKGCAEFTQARHRGHNAGMERFQTEVIGTVMVLGQKLGSGDKLIRPRCEHSRQGSEDGFPASNHADSQELTASDIMSPPSSSCSFV